MRVVVSRVTSASVSVCDKTVGEINNGLMLLTCFTLGDTTSIAEYMAKKVCNLRIFDDEDGVMNKSLLDTNGSILSISQFTLYADTSRGNRPSYRKALGGKEARELYDKFNDCLKHFTHIETGMFGEDMKISANHDGPVTIILDSK